MVSGENKAVKEAANIAMDDIEKAQIEEARVKKEPNVGSFERFMNTFGDTRRWKQ